VRWLQCAGWTALASTALAGRVGGAPRGCCWCPALVVRSWCVWARGLGLL